MTPEDEFKRGLRLMARGRYDLAAIRFQRAERGGVEVFKRLMKGETEPAVKVEGTVHAGDTDKSKDLYQQLLDTKPKDFEKGKNYVPPFQQQREPATPIEIFSQVGEKPSPDFLEATSVPSTGGGEFPDIDVVRAINGTLIYDGADTMSAAGKDIVWVQMNINNNGAAGFQLVLGSLGYTTAL